MPQRYLSALLTVLVAACFMLTAEPSLARYHPSWEWRTMRTDHFTVYYPRGHEPLARRVLALADEVRGDVTGYLDTVPRRCPIVLNPGTDTFNGFYTPLPNSISLFETPVSALTGFGGASDTMDLVFTHEYVHFTHITMRRGWYGALSRVLGDGLAISNGIAPIWLIEGIAVDAETRFTDGGRGASALFRGRWLSFSEGRGLWSMQAASSFPTHEPPGNRPYLSGYHLLDHLAAREGDDISARITIRQAAHPLRTTRGALRHVSGLSPRQFYRDARDMFHEHASAWREERTEAGLPTGEVILAYERDTIADHDWSTRGTLLALRHGYDHPTALIEIDPDNGEVIDDNPLGRTNDIDAVRFLPDERLIYGAMFPHPLGGDDLESGDLVLHDPVTGDRTRLTHGLHVFSGDRSPDGSRYVVARRDGMWSGLVLLDPSGAVTDTLLSDLGMTVAAPRWSPDGSVIAAEVKTGRGSCIALIEPDGSGTRPLFAPDGHQYTGPSFSPDSRWIVCASDRSGGWNIHAFDREQDRLYQLTSAPYAATTPRISPNGRTVSFLTMHRGVMRLCVLPFRPERGDPCPILSADTITAPNSTLTAQAPTPVSGGIPLWEAYRPFVHIPYIGTEEDGFTAGAFIMGGDPIGLNRYDAILTRGIESGRPAYDIGWQNSSFWPVIGVELFDGANEESRFGGHDLWVRKRGAEGSLALNVFQSAAPDYIRMFADGGLRYTKYDAVEDGVRIRHGRDETLSLFSFLSILRQPDMAPRDLVAPGGTYASIYHDKLFGGWGGELPGYNTFASLRYTLPGLFRHDGMILNVVHQRQSGILDHNRFAIPRGYNHRDTEGGFNRARQLTFTAEYRFPIAYTDWGVGLMLYHCDLVRGAFFADHGAGWDGGFSRSSWEDRARTTVGTSLVAEGTVFSIVPFALGFSCGYKVRDDDWFYGSVIGLDSLGYFLSDTLESSSGSIHRHLEKWRSNRFHMF
jgi:Tol biopolymer transport system component